MTPDKTDDAEKPFEKPDFFGSSTVALGKNKNLAVSIGSIAIIILFSAVLAAFSGSSKRAGNPVKDAVGWDTLRIDGNRNGKYVDFDHKKHKLLAGIGETGCRTCHHLSRPNDGPSSCYQCHTDMEESTSVFDHNLHAKIHAENSCRECHTANKRPGQDVKSCGSCHEEYKKDNQFYLKVRGYKPAMHAGCTGCHEIMDVKMAKKRLSNCTFCHENKS